MSNNMKNIVCGCVYKKFIYWEKKKKERGNKKGKINNTLLKLVAKQCV